MADLQRVPSAQRPQSLQGGAGAPEERLLVLAPEVAGHEVSSPAPAIRYAATTMTMPRAKAMCSAMPSLRGYALERQRGARRDEGVPLGAVDGPGGRLGVAWG